MSTFVAAGALAKMWLATLGMVALQGTLLALLAIVVTRAIGRSRPAWQAGVWLVVVAKFALPWGPAMPYSLADLFALLSPHHAQPVVTGPPALQPLPPTPQAWPAIGWLVLAIVWVLVAATILGRALHAYARTRAAARAAAPPPAWARALLHELVASETRPAWTNDHRITLAIGAAAPHVVGLVRPIIVVPPALLEDDQLLRAALLHELAHVRRWDVLGRSAQVWASALCWFVPVVRLVGRRLDLARESACDAWALEASELPRPAYARLLVRMAELRGASGALAFAMPHALDQRVAAVLGPPARARLGVAQRVALVAWVVVALGGARTASAHDRPTCMYTPQLAAALYQSYPEADLDGDGTLSRDEACTLQAQLRRHADERESRVSKDAETEAEFQTLLSEPLCCNCDAAEANCSPQGVDR